MELKSYAASAQSGPSLGVCEDHVKVELDKQLFLIFDGFGGEGVGEKAVVEVADDIARIYGKISGDPDSTLPFFYDSNLIPEGNALVNAALHGHEYLLERNRDKSMGERAGSSAAMIAIGDHLVSLLSCGTIRTLIYGQGNIEEVASESSLKFLGSRIDRRVPLNVPKSALGLFNKLDYSINEVRTSPGDILISLTDGFYSKVSKDEIKSIIEDCNRNLKKCISEFSTLANQRGNLDNQACLLLQF